MLNCSGHVASIEMREESHSRNEREATVVMCFIEESLPKAPKTTVSNLLQTWGSHDVDCEQSVFPKRREASTRLHGADSVK
jgi:hypothetical protein